MVNGSWFNLYYHPKDYCRIFLNSFIRASAIHLLFVGTSPRLEGIPQRLMVGSPYTLETTTLILHSWALVKQNINSVMAKRILENVMKQIVDLNSLWNVSMDLAEKVKSLETSFVSLHSLFGNYFLSKYLTRSNFRRSCLYLLTSLGRLTRKTSSRVLLEG